MKAAFLLLSTSWLAGADAPPAPVPAPAHPAPPAVHSAPIVSGHGYGCASGNCGTSYGAGYGSYGCGSGCCESTWCEKPGLFSRFKGSFSRGGDCCDTGYSGCGDACGCDSGGGLGLFDRLRSKFSRGDDCCDTGCGSHYGGTTWGNDCCDSGCGSGGLGLFDRLRSKFSRGNDCCDTGCGGCGYSGGCATGGCGSSYAPGSPGCGTVHVNPAVPHAVPGQQGTPIMPPAHGGGEAEKLPSTGEKEDNGGGAATIAPAPINIPSQPLKSETRYPFEPGRQYVSRQEDVTDYSTLTGKLRRVSVDGGLWVLRYAPLSEEDPNGGGVVLAQDRSLDSYRDGDSVTVTGRIIAPKGSDRLGGPLYRVSSIRLLDRDSN